ncbi:MAG: hypothetical protein GVY33_16190 [Alphaproteobacteria bacterium]|jgi:hypothetical protein|nr:hypothetical protein [Alphaproteobacteria bacterium]
MDVSSTPAGAATAARAPAVDSVWGRDGFGFDDLLDVVNPLQHLPGVSQVYRRLSGDDIGMLPRIAGGMLFGGPVGAATAMVSAGIEAGTGDGPLAYALAALEAEAAAPPPPPPSPRRVAEAYASAPSPTPHAPPPAVAAEPPPLEWTPPLSGAHARLSAEIERARATAG